MDIIAGLQNKNNAEAYQLLLMLEEESAASNSLYDNFEDFLGLLKSGNSFVRTRGFRLACAQARWDAEDKLAAHFDLLLAALDAGQPTAARQRLAALRSVILYKPQLGRRITDKLDKLDLSKYKDSMRPLIERDMEELRTLIERKGV